jgi:hypothetical protein
MEGKRWGGTNTKKIEENGIWGGYHPGRKTKKVRINKVPKQINSLLSISDDRQWSGLSEENYKNLMDSLE